ncbi:hypothetical protein [Neobacillus sp. FSL H8-0543]|uniref:hypothetical protein n=1 Tax=Neobacillus sp. FSL H8-0543 TaxID=2954672 RepID=UPI0031590A17
MDKAVIFDVFNFVSFHLCKALLDKGIEVEGITIENKGNDDGFSDEKRLEIGRNANYKESLFKDWTKQLDRTDSKMTIICSVYDIYMTYNENILKNDAVAYEFIDCLKRYKEKIERLVLLLPGQILTGEAETEALLVMNDFIKMSEELTENIQLHYLPTIFGPWQPKTFVFQHTILNKMNQQEKFKGLREETMDALYIDDTVETLIDIIENSDAGRYLLESGLENQWDFCAQYLQVDENLLIDRKTSIEEEKVAKLTVNRKESLTNAIAKQINHVQHLFRP